MKVKNIILILINILILLLIAEIILRYKGFKPFEMLEIPTIKCQNENDIKDSLLGFRPKEGEFFCNINGLDYNFVQTKKGRRTHLSSFDSLENKPIIQFYGCSFTWGQGLSDDQTMSWKVQEKLPQFEVQNYGIGASSIVQAYLYLKRNLESKTKPALVVFNYVSFHDMRNYNSNEWSALWRTLLISNHNFTKQMSPLPLVRELKNGKPVVIYMPVEKLGRSLPFCDKFVIINLLNNSINKAEDRSIKPREISISLLEEMNALCKENNVKFLVNALMNDNETLETIQELNSIGIKTALGYVEFNGSNSQKYSLLPYDNHPNEMANELFANKIANYIIAND